MLVSEAKAIAAEWITAHAEKIPGYQGAYLAGSICWLDDTDTLCPFSDVDIHLVVAGDAKSPGKAIHNQLLLEPSVVTTSEIEDVEQILQNPAIGSSIWRNQLLDDPHETLRPVFDQVVAQFAEPRWIRNRIEDLCQVLRNLRPNDPSAPIHQQAMWIVPATRTTHVIQLGALHNPTVRKRFVAAKPLLSPDNLDLYEELLETAGLRDLELEESRQWLSELEQVFAFASGVTTSTSRWKSDISADAHQAAIEGTRHLMATGWHREAMFWVVVTYARALDVLHQSQESDSRWQQPFSALLERVGLHTPEAIRARTERVHAVIPRVKQVAESLVHP